MASFLAKLGIHDKVPGIIIPHPLRNLDILRAAAVSFVFLGHLIKCLTIRPQLIQLFDGLARAGVMVFFVHTSFVLLLSIDRMKETGSRLFHFFYLRRAFRIYPMSILFVLCVVGLKVPFMPDERFTLPTWHNIVANILLIQNITRGKSVCGPLWSLPWEVQMYIVLPFFYLFLRTWFWPALLGVWTLACVLSCMGAALNMKEFRLLTYVPCFLGGGLTFVLVTGHKTLPKCPAWLWPVTICTLSLGLACGDPFGASRRVIYPDWIMCAVLGLLIPLFHESSNRVVTVVSGAVAKYSYGIYLAHVPLMWLVFVRLISLPLWCQLVTLFSLTAIIPLLTFHLVEDPLINVGKYLTQPRARNQGVSVEIPTVTVSG